MLQTFKNVDDIKDKPSSISKIIVSPSVNFEDDAYIYEYINIDNQKKYVGWHADSEKTYWHSSENKDFQKIFASSEPNLILTILEMSIKFTFLDIILEIFLIYLI